MKLRPLHDRVVVRRVKKSRRKAKSSPSALVRLVTTTSVSRSTSKLVIACSSVNGPARK